MHTKPKIVVVDEPLQNVGGAMVPVQYTYEAHLPARFRNVSVFPHPRSQQKVKGHGIDV